MAMQQQQMAQMQQQAAAAPVAAPAPAPAAGGMSAETMTQLQQLAQLKEAGILTDAEFAAQKAKILAAVALTKTNDPKELQRIFWQY